MKLSRAHFPWALVFVAACSTYRPGDGPLTDFEFLEGTWSRSTAKVTVEEVWTSNAGWSLKGVGRTLKNGAVVDIDRFAIEPRGTRFVLVSHPDDSPPVEFELAGRGLTWLRFENRAHDFPQRIEYRRDGDALQAAVSGTVDGRPQREVIEYRRVADR